MPRVHVHEGSHKVKAKSGSESDDDDPRATGREEGLQEGINTVLGVEAGRVASSEGSNHKVHREDDQVQLDYAEGDKGSDVSPP